MNIEQFEAVFKGVACAILFIGVLFVIGILRTTSDKSSGGTHHEGGTGSGWDNDDADCGWGGWSDGGGDGGGGGGGGDGGGGE